MDQLMLCTVVMIVCIAWLRQWSGLSLVDSDEPPWPGRRSSRFRRPWQRSDTPDLVVPPGRRSKSLNEALKRVQRAAPDAVHREQGGTRRYTLVPRVREEISAVLEDRAIVDALADAEARELRRAFETKCTYILGTHAPHQRRRVNSIEHLILKCAAAPVPDKARWRQEWMAEYLAMSHYPAHVRSRFLMGLLMAAPRLSRELKRSDR